MHVKIGNIVRLKDSKQTAKVVATKTKIGDKIVEGCLILDKPLNGHRLWSSDNVVVVR